jgi:hypothetical protein
MGNQIIFYFFDDTATVVIAVGVGTTNLAFGKPATQSSNYYKTDRYRASMIEPSLLMVAKAVLLA